MASSMTVVKPTFQSDDTNVVRITLACTAHTDGSFTSAVLINPDDMQFNYWQKGFRLANAWTVNPSSGYPTSAGTITITDAASKQLTGSTAGDTLAVSTSASGLAMLSITRSGSQRLVTSPLYVTISSIGASALTFTLYVELERY